MGRGLNARLLVVAAIGLGNGFDTQVDELIVEVALIK